MIRFHYFPNKTKDLTSILDIFKSIEDSIDSTKAVQHKNDVLSLLKEKLETMNFTLKQKVSVLDGKQFSVDAVNKNDKIVIKIEAGRAVVNNEFLKDIVECSLMLNVEYLVLAVCNVYKMKTGENYDFEYCYNFINTIYNSDRVSLSLKSILLIGY
ncbi:MAG: hypothetical protein IJ180_06820 [Bacteroidales bacterium]|nr:hypothetical protein [Bacteroidales bacterium]